MIHEEGVGRTVALSFFYWMDCAANHPDSSLLGRAPLVCNV